MKILRISVHNIASLAGTHHVDFTQEPLRSAGLFSISGPTGSGKSSLLDAVCVALFDRIPRLNRAGRMERLEDGVTQDSTANLLRRGAGSGWAEVVFTGVDGQIRTARWSIRRSYNRSDGRLQAPEMVLYRGDVRIDEDGPIEAGGKKTEVQQAIVRWLGLNFDQFTRAVLLAQNEFSAFLKAGDRERAEILQALTGTDRFERISQTVYARAREQQQQIELLEAQFEGIRPLSEDERRLAEERLHRTIRQQHRTEQKLDIVRRFSDWYEQRQRLQKDCEKAEQAHRKAQQDLADLEPRRQQLETTKTVQREAAVLWNEWEQAVHRQTLAEARQAELTDRLQKLQHEEQGIRAACETADRDLAQKETERQNIEPLIRQARALDSRLDLARENLRQAQTHQEEATGEHDRSVAEYERRQNVLSHIEQQTAELQPAAERLKQYEPFLEQSTRWLQLVDDAIRETEEYRECHQAVEHLQQRISEIDSAMADVQESVDIAARQHADAEQALTKAQEAEAAFDGDRLAVQRAALDQEYHALTELKERLAWRVDRLRTCDQIVREIQEHSETRQRDQKHLEQLREQIPSAQAAVQAAAAQLKFMEQAVSDHVRHLRSTLQDGQPCPVCGAREHPFRDDAPGIEGAALQAARNHLDELTARLQDLQEQAVRLETNLDMLTDQMSRDQEQLDALQTDLRQQKEACRAAMAALQHETPGAIPAIDKQSELPADTDGGHQEDEGWDVVASVQQWFDETRKHLDHIHETRQELELQEQAWRQAASRLQECRLQEQSCRETFQEQQTHLQDLTEQRSSLQEQLSAAESRRDAAGRRRQDVLMALAPVWNGLPEARSRFDDDPATFRDELESGLRRCRDIRERLKDFEAERSALVKLLEPLQAAVTRAAEQLRTRQAAADQAAQQVEELQKERSCLLEGRSATEAEQQTAAAVRESEQALRSLQKRHHETERELEGVRAEYRAAQDACRQAEKDVQLCRSRLDRWRDAFRSSSGLSLTDEQLRDFLERDRTWLETEERLLKEANDRVTAARTTQADCRRRLEQHDRQRPTRRSESEIADLRSDLEAEQAQRQAAVADAQADLAADDQVRQQRGRTQQQLDAARTAAEPWQKLSDLIGSRDGDRFRMIAQRRTLDVLLRQANFHLEQLSGRYRLERLPESLNLIVVDQHMGDERRSVLSLSGGESFLVSLALALGLASLTSGRLKIESLFIDEGFGSLDPDTLSVVLGALMHLQSQGRRVGVISHVTEMADAIQVRIRVVRGSGGASSISLPQPFPAADS